MGVQVDENAIKIEVEARVNQELAVLQSRIQVDEYTPKGNLRSTPLYYVTAMNMTLGKSKMIKGKSEAELMMKVQEQLGKWAAQEIRSLASQAKKDAKEAAQADAEEASQQAKEYLDELRGILNATLDFDDRIDWKELEDHRSFQRFSFPSAPKKPGPPPPPTMPKKPFFSFLVKSLARKWEARCTELEQQHQNALARLEQQFTAETEKWKVDKEAARSKHADEKKAFLAAQEKRNAAVAAFKVKFEAGDPEAVVEYAHAVFERSTYPEDVDLEYVVNIDAPAQTLVVNVSLLDQESVTDICEYKYVTKTNDKKPVTMKKKEHDALYDDMIKQIIIRTIHEVFEAVYTKHVMNVVVNGWVTYVDKATGNDQTSCIISVSADREEFEKFNLARIDHTECIKAMKGLTAGPLSSTAPVKPIMQLDTDDARLVESKAVLAEINATTNLAEIPWEDFEHLVRDLFAEMFSGEGVEVRVTQASRDQGVDAIAFDPDPIRGGKVVIQAKRYTKTVGVAAVRELFGTMMAEGAVKGILVTTASYGRDSRQFVKDKPITLIDGANLVYLLEQHGHKVRIDVEAARAKM
jgi:restriction system protein